MSRQLYENYDVKWETVHCYLQNVDHGCTWSLESKRSFQILLLFCFANNKSLNDWSLGEQWILFPSNLNVSIDFVSGNIEILSSLCYTYTWFNTLSKVQKSTVKHIPPPQQKAPLLIKSNLFFWHTKECCSFAVTTILLREGGLGTKLLSFYFFKESGNLIRNYNTANVMKFGWMSNFTG